MASHRQVVFVAFHMAAMPLVAALLASACTETHSRPGHVFIGPRNLGWLGMRSSRWIFDASETIIADLPGLRRLISGLRAGTITRLLVLLDGPHPTGGPETRALTNIAPTLAFRTGLMSRILDMGIPMRPLTHHWESDALVLNWHPYLNHPWQPDGSRTKEEALSRMASLIEDLLLRHPAQWLNWNAASLRP
jgi:lauroyl/myristoyl acyltransferase